MNDIFEFDIVIVTWNRPDKLIRCLKSIEQSLAVKTTDKIKFQVHVLVNGDDPKSVNVLSEMQKTVSFPLNVQKSQVRNFPGAARNLLVQQTKNSWKFFLDDDAWLIENYFDVLNEIYQKHIRNNSVYYMAGPNLTFSNSSFLAKLTQFVLENPIYAPYVYKRYARPNSRTEKKLSVEVATEAKSILCNFWLNHLILAELNPKRRLESSQFFDVRLMGGEESELVHALEASSIAGIYSTELAVWHERRSTWVGFFKQMLKYGEGRGVVIKYHRRLNWFHLVPVVFLFFFGISVVFGGAVLLIVFYLIYLATGAAYSIFLNGWFAGAGVLLAPIVHLGYGIGVIKGFLFGNYK